MNEATARSASLIGLILLVSSLVSPMTLLDDMHVSAESNDNGCVVCINEVMANADGSDQGFFPNGEWVELYNSGLTGLSLENWTLEDIGGWVHPLDAGTWVGFDQLNTPYVLTAGAYAIIAENEVGTLRLNNAGETLYLKDSEGLIVHTMISGASSNGVSKIPNHSDSSEEWIDSEENTPGLENSEAGVISDTTPSSLTRIMTMPFDAEVTGMHVDANGNFFVNAMHPDDNYIDATIGVVNGVDWNNLPDSIPELTLPNSISEKTSIRVSYGQYQHLLQKGETLSEGVTAGGIYADDDGALLFVSEKPDFNAFVPLNPQGTKGYLYTTWEDRPAGISQIMIEWNTSTNNWDVLGGMMRDLGAIGGGWVMCFGTMSPWGTPLASEELYFDDTENWNNPNYNYHSDQTELEDYLGYYPNPYDYGYIVEIEEPTTTSGNLVKHMAMGRYSHENAQIMPDERTVYLSDDGYGTVLFKFIADTAGDLSAGTLYAAKVTQDESSNSATTGFDVEWLEMASSSNSEIEDWVNQYDGITVSDYTNGQNSYITESEINNWAEWHLNDDLDGDGVIETVSDNRVAFLESRKAASAIGASDEWNKMEGVIFNPNAPEYIYLAMSDIGYDMSDGLGDIDVSENHCGIVYSMPVESNWDINRIEPAIIGGTYSSGSSQNQCDVNNLAGPDNLAVLDDGRVLIGEDTNKHQNNMVWLWNPSVEPVDWEDAGSSEWNGEYDVKFTSIMPGEIPGRDNDWLEITNFGDEDVNLTGWTIERIRPTTPWISTFGQFTIAAGESAFLSENPANLLADGGIIAYDGNAILNNMPWLVDSGAALQLKEPEGTVVDALVYNGGDAEIEGWNGGAVSVPGDGSPGLILMRGDGCTPGGDSDSAIEWEIRWIRIGASTFCDGGLIEAHSGMSATASFSPETGLEDLLGWISEADTSLHIHVYEFLHPDLTHALIAALNRDVSVTLLIEDGILDSSNTINDQRGHAQAVSDAGGTVLWMVDPSEISSPYSFIHSKVAVKDSESVWISSGNWKESSLPTVDESGNREWSLFLDSSEVATKVLERMSFDENVNHLHIDAHSSYYAPTGGWELPNPSSTLPNDSPNPDATTPFRTRLLTCPDDCVTGLVSEIDNADSRIRLSIQYLDLDWYWGFGAENPILAALHSAAQRGVKIELMLNAFYADYDDDIRDTVNLFNTDWNGTQGLDVNARLMATAPDIWKLHNKGMIIDDDTVLVGSMNWGSNSMLRNREMGIISESTELTAVYAAKFDSDWNRLDENTDSDGDMLPDSWEVLYGLDRHSAAVPGTALSEQSLDPDEDGLDNLNEYLLNGDPTDEDTDDDCILDGEEPGFAQSVMRSPGVSMVSGDVDENGIPDGEQYDCEEEVVITDPNNGNSGENNTGGNNEGGGGITIINVRDDPLSTPGAKFLLGLTVIAGISVIGAGLSIISRPKTKAEEKLIDDSGYIFDDADLHKAILSGTRFDESSEDTRQWTEGRDDGKHGSIVLDGFGFEELSRDEVQWRLDQGISIEELRDEFGEDEA